MTKIYNIIVGSLGIAFVFFYPTLLAMTPSRPPDGTSHVSHVKSFKKLSMGEQKRSDRLDIAGRDGYKINFVCFGVLQFFMAHIKNKHVLKAIVRGIKNCPDRVVKLYFFCMDCKNKSVFSASLVRGIEAFIIHKLPNRDLRYLTFRWSCTRMPMFAVLDAATEKSYDIYDRNFSDRLERTVVTMKTEQKSPETYRTLDNLSDEFQRGLVIDKRDEKDGKTENYSNLEQQTAEGATLLRSLIKNYVKFRRNSEPEAKKAIDLLRFNALSFFSEIIKNKRVLTEIVQSIKYFPDKAIKLYFYCLEYYYMNQLNENMIRSLEISILNDIKFHKERFSLRYLTFLRNSKGLLELETRLYGGGGGDVYDDISDE